VRVILAASTACHWARPTRGVGLVGHSIVKLMLRERKQQNCFFFLASFGGLSSLFFSFFLGFFWWPLDRGTRQGF
jgi:hypothetical protein